MSFGPSTSSTASAMPAPALPAPTTTMRRIASNRNRVVADQQRLPFDAEPLRHEPLRQDGVDARLPDLQGIAAELGGSGHNASGDA